MNSTIVTATFVISAYLLPVILRVVHREYFVTYLLLVEDGVYESVGALACLVSGLLFGGLFLFCRHSVDQAPPKRNPWWLFFAVGFLVMFLEEMSWGQRVLGYSSPNFFADHNLTREANLHNMRTFYLGGTTTNVLQAVWMLLVIGYLGLLPFLARLLPRFACWLKRIGLPTPTMAIAVAMILNTAGFVVYLLGTQSDGELEAGQQSTELFEAVSQSLLAGVAFTTFASKYTTSLRNIVLVPTFVVTGSVAISLLVVALRTNIAFVVCLDAIRTGDGLYSKGDFAGALHHYDVAVMRWPQSALGHYQKGCALEALGRAEEAELAFRQATTLFPKFANAHGGLGRLYLARGEFSQATAHLREALALEPENGDAWNNLGVLQMRRGDVKTAAECFERALRSDPNHHAARDNLQKAKDLLLP